MPKKLFTWPPTRKKPEDPPSDTDDEFEDMYRNTYGPPATEDGQTFDSPEVNDNSQNKPTPKPQPRRNINKNKVTEPKPKDSTATEAKPTDHTESTKDQEAPKRKLTTESPPASTKKTKDVPPHKDMNIELNKENIAKITINGKACVQRNLDFSANRPKSKILVGSQVRLSWSPNNPRPRTVQGPRSRSRHRDSGSAEGGGNTHAEPIS